MTRKLGGERRMTEAQRLAASAKIDQTPNVRVVKQPNGTWDILVDGKLHEGGFFNFTEAVATAFDLRSEILKASIEQDQRAKGVTR